MKEKRTYTARRVVTCFLALIMAMTLMGGMPFAADDVEIDETSLDAVVAPEEVEIDLGNADQVATFTDGVPINDDEPTGSEVQTVDEEEVTSTPIEPQQEVLVDQRLILMLGYRRADGTLNNDGSLLKLGFSIDNFKAINIDTNVEYTGTYFSSGSQVSFKVPAGNYEIVVPKSENGLTYLGARQNEKEIALDNVKIDKSSNGNDPRGIQLLYDSGLYLTAVEPEVVDFYAPVGATQKELEAIANASLFTTIRASDGNLYYARRAAFSAYGLDTSTPTGTKPHTLINVKINYNILRDKNGNAIGKFLINKDSVRSYLRARMHIVEDVVSLTLEGDGIDASPKGTMATNTEVTLTLTPPAGKELDDLTLNGVSVKDGIVDNKYTFTITEDTTVIASWKDIPTKRLTINTRLGYLDDSNTLQREIGNKDLGILASELKATNLETGVSYDFRKSMSNYLATLPYGKYRLNLPAEFNGMTLVGVYEATASPTKVEDYEFEVSATSNNLFAVYDSNLYLMAIEPVEVLFYAPVGATQSELEAIANASRLTTVLASDGELYHVRRDQFSAYGKDTSQPTTLFLLDVQVHYNEILDEDGQKTGKFLIRKEPIRPYLKGNIIIYANVTLSLDGEGLTSEPAAGTMAADTEVTLTLTAPAGKELDDLTLNGVSVKDGIVDNKYTFTIKEDTEAAVTWKAIPVNLTLVGDGITSQPEAGVLDYGSEVVITLEAPNQHILDDLKSNGISVKDSVVNNIYTFTIEEDTTIEVSWLRRFNLGLEIRDLANARTTEIPFDVKDANDALVSGAFNTSGQWFANELEEGIYTITFEPPEETAVVINETVASQKAIKVGSNTFEITLNKENDDAGLSAIWGAFKLVKSVPGTPLEPALVTLNNEEYGVTARFFSDAFDRVVALRVKNYPYEKEGFDTVGRDIYFVDANDYEIPASLLAGKTVDIRMEVPSLDLSQVSVAHIASNGAEEPVISTIQDTAVLFTADTFSPYVAMSPAAAEPTPVPTPEPTPAVPTPVPTTEPEPTEPTPVPTTEPEPTEPTPVPTTEPEPTGPTPMPTTEPTPVVTTPVPTTVVTPQPTPEVTKTDPQDVPKTGEASSLLPLFGGLLLAAAFVLIVGSKVWKKR